MEKNSMEYNFKIEYIKRSSICIAHFLNQEYNEKESCKILKCIVMCLKGQEMLHKGNLMIYYGLVMIDGAQEELSKLCPNKSLQNHLKVQTL